MFGADLAGLSNKLGNFFVRGSHLSLDTFMGMVATGEAVVPVGNMFLVYPTFAKSSLGGSSTNAAVDHYVSLFAYQSDFKSHL